jgi:hypothetical protein
MMVNEKGGPAKDRPKHKIETSNQLEAVKP